MAFGRKKQSAEQALQNQISETRKRLAELTSKLQDAETGARSNHARARELTIANAAGADETALGHAEQAITAFERRVATLTTAIAETNANLSQLEGEFAALVLAKDRQAAATRLEGEASALEKCIDDFSRAMTALRDAAAAASENAQFEIGKLREYAEASLIEIPETITAAAELLRGQARQILSGELRPRLQIQPSQPTKTVQEPLRRVFTLAAVSWRERGVEKSSAKHQFADLPIPVATKALALGYAIQPNDGRAVSHGFAAAPLPGPNCVNLEDENLKPFRPAFGIDRAKISAGMQETGVGRQSWIGAERGR